MAATDHVYQRDAKLFVLDTTVVAVVPFADLAPSSQGLFKQGSPADFAVVTSATIFHPQGGGQPSDVGTMTAVSTSAGPGTGDSIFNVALARVDVADPGRVLHFGQFAAGAAAFSAGQPVHQAIDVDKRFLYSRMHTAGHVLGGAVRTLVEHEVAGFDELKASHFPDAASCEFRGKIDGSWLAPIQSRLDAFIAAAIPVEVEWWDAADFHANGLERLLPDKLPTGVVPDASQKLRVIRIAGAHVITCGGTHVDTTDLCGPTKVTKISRSKGNSRVSYALA